MSLDFSQIIPDDINQKVAKKDCSRFWRKIYVILKNGVNGQGISQEGKKNPAFCMNGEIETVRGTGGTMSLHYIGFIGESGRKALGKFTIFSLKL